MTATGNVPNNRFDPVAHPVCLEFPIWLEETAWAGHIPFAMFLISAMRPRILVELGAYRGVSYCAFCQAVKKTGSNTKCYAVDTWEGDEHSGRLDTGALTKLQAHHDPLYAGFSRLIQSTFDDALVHFADGSVDLLHIDGFHTYEAVSHDFETWKPKMSDRGVILFHDINVRERGFGVWQFWDNVKREYPHFEFSHSHGLGVLVIGRRVPENLKFILTADEEQTTVVREFFFALGERVENAIKYKIQNSFIQDLQKRGVFLRNRWLAKAYRALKKKVE